VTVKQNRAERVNKQSRRSPARSAKVCTPRLSPSFPRSSVSKGDVCVPYATHSYGGKFHRDWHSGKYSVEYSRIRLCLLPSLMLRLRTRQLCGEQNFVANYVFSWAFSGDPVGRPYNFRTWSCL